MNNTITNDDIHEIFQASQAAFSRLEVTKNSRLFQLNLLYQTIKDGAATKSIMRAIGILDEQYAEQWSQYLTLVQAHVEALKAAEDLPQQPPQ